MKKIAITLLTFILSLLIACSNQQEDFDIQQALTDATYLGQGLEIPDFNLTDQNAQLATKDLLRDSYNLLFFGFTNCPDICPITLGIISMIELIVNDTVNLIFVSVDPLRDSPEMIKNYLNNFNARFIGLTGDEEELAKLWSALGITVHRMDDPDGSSYNVTHNGTVFLLNPEGRMIGLTNHPADPVSLNQDIALMISQD
ncbi:MAG: SCO family protein [Proteobacteria bacterium]|jgi:protein SCO1/2|nr:SCO family protein [Pseudomonadota bacterium]